MAINNSGDIAGSSVNSSGKSRATLWPAGNPAAQDWQTLAGNSDPNKESYATGINSVGRMVGKSMFFAGNTGVHAFRTLPLAPIQQGNDDDLGNLVGVETANSEANWINDLDEVVGATAVANGQYHAFWKDGNSAKHQAFVDLGVLTGDNYSMALGLNNTGHVVGHSKNTTTGVQRAVVWFNNGTKHDLITKVNNGSGWSLKSAECINNSGWIVGWGVKSGYDRAFVLVPNY
jgi:probable HAF family extracellular repeat protein